MISTPLRFVLVLLAATLPLSGCDRLDQTKGWFSNSEYDPEIEAIEREVPPPEEPFAPAAAVDPAVPAAAPASYLGTTSGGHVVADPPDGMAVRLGGSTVARADAGPSHGGVSGAAADLAAASSETGLTRSATPPPLGYARVRHGSHGSAVAPFRPSPSTSRSFR